MMTLMLVQFRTRRLHANGLDFITTPPTIAVPTATTLYYVLSTMFRNNCGAADDSMQ